MYSTLRFGVEQFLLFRQLMLTASVFSDQNNDENGCVFSLLRYGSVGIFLSS